MFAGGFIISSQVDPLFLRFVADVADVYTMHPMFCEGLASRVAAEVCEPLAQADTKKTLALKVYNQFMTEARTVNAIITGSEEPALDDWLAARR
jgi:diphthamide synthase (EF-2-diphthine--ammonia ligase)